MFETGERLPLYMAESDSEIILTADVPSMPAERLSLSYEHDWLRICGEWSNIEYTAGCHVTDVDAAKANVTVSGGLLTIRLPKTRTNIRIDLK